MYFNLFGIGFIGAVIGSVLSLIIKDYLDGRRARKKFSVDERRKIGNFILEHLVCNPKQYVNTETVLEMMKFSTRLETYNRQFAWNLRMLFFHGYGAYSSNNSLAMKKFSECKEYCKKEANRLIGHL